MKKRNLLSLGALVLSLGLTVTSCAGAQGDKGDKGDKGDTGAQGAKGDKGDDGKTYIAVIVDSWKFKDVKVTQDKYFVEPGETVTFTFEAASTAPTGEVLTSVEFNGVEYLSSVVEANDKGVATLAVKTSTADKGYQMTAAEFGTAKNYAYNLIDARLEEISEADHAVILASDATVTGSVLKAHDAVNAKYSGVYGKDVTLWGSVRNAADAKVNSVEIKDTMTMAEKIAAYKKAAEEGISDINKAYETLLTNAKNTAKTTINNATDTTKGLKATDWANDKAKAVSDVEAATTLEGIAKVMQSSAIAASSDAAAFAQGSFYALKAAKDSVLGSLNSALTSATTTDAWMLNDTTAHKTELASMKSKLADYGVTLDKLPSEIYSTWAEKASAATSFEKDSKGNYVMAEEGSKEIKESYTKLKSELAEAIKTTYFNEINNSKALASLTDAKSALRAVVETTVSNFVTADKDLTSSATSSKAISLYLNETITSEAGSESSTGLIGNIEINLAKAIVNNQVDAFASERLDNALADAKTKLLAKAKEYRTKDSLYGSVFGEAILNSNGGVIGYKSVETVITNGKTGSNLKALVNKSTTTTGETQFITANAIKFVAATSTVAEHWELDETADDYSTEAVAYAQYNELYSKRASTYKTVAAIKSYVNGTSTGLKAVEGAYDIAITALQNQANAVFVGLSIAGLTKTSVTGIKDNSIASAWSTLKTNKKLNSFDAISKAAVAADSASSSIVDLDKELGAYLEKVQESDPDYVGAGNFFLANSNSTFKKSVDELVSGLVAGTKTDSDEKSFVSESALEASYKADVSNWFANVKSVLNDRYAAQYKDTKDTEEGLALKKRWEAFSACFGHKVKMDTSSACGYSVDDDKGTISTFKGESLTACNAIERMFDNLVVAKDLTVVQALEKDYVASKFSDVTTASKPGKVLSDIAGKTIKLTSDATSLSTAGDTKLVASKDSSFAVWGTDTAADGTYKVDLSSYSLFCSLVDAVYENEGKAGTSVTYTNIYLNVKASASTSGGSVDTWTVTGFEGALSAAVDNASYKAGLSDSDKATLKSTLKGYVGSKIWIEIDNLSASKANAKIVKISTSELKASTISSEHSFAVLDLSTNSSNAAWSELVTAVATNGAVEGAADSDWANFSFTDYAAG